MGIVIALILILISCHIIWRSAIGFEIASDFLGRNLSKGIKGATINAIASSMPELLATFFFLFYIKDIDGFSGGIGITAGSAIFNGMIIPALVILFVLFFKSASKINVSKKVLLRDGLVLIITECVLILFISGNALHWWHGLILMIMYLLYLTFMFLTIKFRKSNVKPIVKEYKLNFRKDKFIKKVFYLNVECIIIGKEKIKNSNAWILLIVSTMIMAVGSLLLVQGTEWVGRREFDVPFLGTFKGLNLPIIFIAVIIAAAASSVPDTIISIKDAMKGNYDDAISNALGSNTFDISFALGFPLFLYTLFNGSIEMNQEIIELSTVLRVVLLIITIIGFFIIISGRYLGKIKAFLLLGIYLLFLLFILGEANQLEITKTISGYLIDFVNLVKF